MRCGCWEVLLDASHARVELGNAAHHFLVGSRHPEDVVGLDDAENDLLRPAVLAVLGYGVNNLGLVWTRALSRTPPDDADTVLASFTPALSAISETAATLLPPASDTECETVRHQQAT